MELLRPRKSKELAWAIVPMLTLRKVRGKGRVLDIKFKQQPFPRMTTVCATSGKFLTVLVTQKSNGGLQVWAIGDSGEDWDQYKCEFQYSTIRELFLDFPVLWNMRTGRGWRSKADKLLQMLVAGLDVMQAAPGIAQSVTTTATATATTNSNTKMYLVYHGAEARKREAFLNFNAMVIQAKWRGELGRRCATHRRRDRAAGGLGALGGASGRSDGCERSCNGHGPCSCAKDTALRAQKIGTEALEREVELLRACPREATGMAGRGGECSTSSANRLISVISLPT